MDSDLERRMAQLARMSRDGAFGVEAQRATVDWEGKAPKGVDVFHKVVSDFYSKDRGKDDALIFQSADLFCRLLIAVYRDTKKQDEFVANGYLHAFVRDFDNIEGSCFYPQWESLAKASFTFKQSTKNVLLAERQSLELFRAYNEFLNSLLAYLLIARRVALRKTYSLNVFKQPYGAKLNEFRQLTNGDDGAFFIIFRLANPKLRNVIAHSDAWLDRDSNKVRYTDGQNERTVYEVELVEFMAHITVGSHLAQAYLAAIAAIAVLEDGTPADVSALPPHIVKIFGYRTDIP